MTKPERQSGGGKRLEQQLRDVVARFDPVPEIVRARAREAGRMPVPENSELLELVYDSALDPDIAVIGDAPIRLLSFAGPLRLEVRVDARRGERRLSAWTAPLGAAVAALRTEQGSSGVTVDDDGTFSVPCAKHGRVSIVVETAAPSGPRRKFHSSWFTP